MKEFGVVYILSGDYWERTLALSQATLPSGVDVEVIQARNLRDCFVKRLELPKNLPFKRTLYLDCDVVYLSNSFPSWIYTKQLITGLGVNGWYPANHIWQYPQDWEKQFDSLDEIKNLPDYFIWPCSGLLLLESQAAQTCERWKYFWETSGAVNLEPAFLKAFKEWQPIDILPSDFHIPSYAFFNPFTIRLNEYYFVHAVGREKIEVMQQVIERRQNDIRKFREADREQ